MTEKVRDPSDKDSCCFVCSCRKVWGQCGAATSTPLSPRLVFCTSRGDSGVDSILACGVNTHLVLRELRAAAEAGAVRPNRSVPGRFIAHGALVKMSFVLAEPQPGVLVITVMLIE